VDPVEISESEHRVFEGPPEIFRFPDDFHNPKSAAEPQLKVCLIVLKCHKCLK
jgi:hypothetical protein